MHKMFDVKITVLRKAEYKDLMEKYENPIAHACEVEEGQIFVSVNADIGICGFVTGGKGCACSS